MKLSREYVRGILTEGEVKFSGILKLMPSPDIVSQAESILTTIPTKTVVSWEDEPMPVKPLPSDKFHITLAHQSVLKPFKKPLKIMGKTGFQGLIDSNGKSIVPPIVQLDPQWKERTDLVTQRRSYVAEVVNQDVVGAYLNSVMALVGGPLNVWETETPPRKFHVSLANLTGNPGDSVR